MYMDVSVCVCVCMCVCVCVYSQLRVQQFLNPRLQSVRQIHSSLSESANGHEHCEDENFPMHQQFIPPMIFIIIIIFIIIVIVIITIIITVPAT